MLRACQAIIWEAIGHGWISRSTRLLSGSNSSRGVATGSGTRRAGSPETCVGPSSVGRAGSGIASHREEVMLRERPGKVIHDSRPLGGPVRDLPTNLPQTSRLRDTVHRGRL